MDCEHAVEAVLQNCPGRAVPSELDVALVADDEYVVVPAPLGEGVKVFEGSGGVSWAGDPKDAGAFDVFGRNGIEAKPPVLVDGYGHRSAVG